MPAKMPGDNTGIKRRAGSLRLTGNVLSMGLPEQSVFLRAQQSKESQQQFCGATVCSSTAVDEVRLALAQAAVGCCRKLNTAITATR